MTETLTGNQTEMANLTNVYAQSQSKNITPDLLIESELNSDRIITDQMLDDMLLALLGTGKGRIEVLSPMIVLPPNESGRYGVIDGRTRLLSIRKGVEKGDVQAPDTIPCIVLTEKQAADTTFIESLIQVQGSSNNQLKLHERIPGLMRLITNFIDNAVKDTKDPKAVRKAKTKAVKHFSERFGFTEQTINQMIRFGAELSPYGADLLRETDSPVSEYVRNLVYSGDLTNVSCAVTLHSKFNILKDDYAYPLTIEEFFAACQKEVGTDKAGVQKPVQEDIVEAVYNYAKNFAENEAKRNETIVELQNAASVITGGHPDIIPPAIQRAIDSGSLKPETLEKFAATSEATGKTVEELMQAAVKGGELEAESGEEPVIDDRGLNRSLKEIAASKEMKEAKAAAAKAEIAQISDDTLLKTVKSVITDLSSVERLSSFDSLDREALEALHKLFKVLPEKLDNISDKSAKRLNPPVAEAKTESTPEAA